MAVLAEQGCNGCFSSLDFWVLLGLGEPRVLPRAAPAQPFPSPHPQLRLPIYRFGQKSIFPLPGNARPVAGGAPRGEGGGPAGPAPEPAGCPWRLRHPVLGTWAGPAGAGPGVQSRGEGAGKRRPRSGQCRLQEASASPGTELQRFIASICLPWQRVCLKGERRDSHCYWEENRT